MSGLVKGSQKPAAAAGVDEDPLAGGLVFGQRVTAIRGRHLKAHDHTCPSPCIVKAAAQEVPHRGRCAVAQQTGGICGYENSIS